MYKLLLSWRYLRTRYIALASIISVTLGVATMIVVNSVMAGFTAEMHKRLHGILSDVVVEGPGLDAIHDPYWHMEQIRQVLGDDLAGMTQTVRVPAMLNFQYRGRWVTQQVMLIGIDKATYANVSDFSQYLLHEKNRQQLEFTLREDGYDEKLPQSGWGYRRERIAFEREYREQLKQVEEIRRETARRQAEFSRELLSPLREAPSQIEDKTPAAETFPNPEATGEEDARFAILPTPPPGYIEEHPEEFADQPHLLPSLSSEFEELQSEQPERPAANPSANIASGGNPFAKHQPAEENLFDEAKEQHTGVILGFMISNVRTRDDEGQVKDYFLCRPGDDVKITFPNSSMPPQAVSDNFTVVDLYESKMSEYDSSFAFVPIEMLQKLRGMIDPASGVETVTSIQLKLREGADLNVVRDKLRERFPADAYAYRIQTWRDMQGPLLAAVRLETTILNILLFLIIAVAGFGILATFFMIVVEKTRDIGILKALGAPSGGVMSIFLSYGFCLGIVGSGVGMVGGLLFVHYINEIAGVVETITGQEVFDPTVYYFQSIPTIIQPLTIAWVVAGAIGIAVAASILPAMRAARMHPVEALRYE